MSFFATMIFSGARNEVDVGIWYVASNCTHHVMNTCVFGAPHATTRVHIRTLLLLDCVRGGRTATARR